MTVFLLFLAALSALLLAAFCAGAETGFLSVGRERILHLSRAGGRKAKIVHAALSDMSRTLTTLLIGNNLAGVVFSSASAALAIRALVVPPGALSRLLSSSMSPSSFRRCSAPRGRSTTVSGWRASTALSRRS